MKNIENQTNTFVIEFNNITKINEKENVEIFINKYLRKIISLLELEEFQNPVYHLSPKYGFSVWLPLAPHSAIHIYIWDDRVPSFVSVDICSLFTNEQVLEICKITKSHFDVFHNKFTIKSMQEPNRWNWVDLDSSIIRQRLNITSTLNNNISNDEVSEFMIQLCKELKMVSLGKPIINDKQIGWMHWETSGCIFDWRNSTLILNIYTCYSFDTNLALKFVKDMFHLEKVNHTEF